MNVEALIVDLDGTLADTEEAHRVAFNLAFQRHRLDWNWSPDAYRSLLRVTGGKERLAHYLRTLALPDAERERLRALLPSIHAEKTRFYSSLVNDGGVPLRDGVARLLHEAREARCRLAIASTTSAVNVDALLKTSLGGAAGKMFDVIVCGDQVRARKPAPDIYRRVLDELGIGPQRAIALEDSANGLHAARAAGLWTLVTPSFWTLDDDLSAADWRLPRLGDPALPLPGEPGKQLEDGAWLSFAELARRVRATRRPLVEVSGYGALVA